MLKKVLRGQPQPNGFLRNLRQPKFSQIFLTRFSTKVMEAFLSANIPLYKLNNPELKKLFASVGQPLLSETCCRRKVNELNWNV